MPPELHSPQRARDPRPTPWSRIPTRASSIALRIANRVPYRLRRLLLRPVAALLVPLALRWPNLTIVATPALLARAASSPNAVASILAIELGTGHHITPARRRAVIRIAEAARMHRVVRQLAAEAGPDDDSPEVRGGRALLALEAGHYGEALATAAPAVAAGDRTAIRVSAEVAARLTTLSGSWLPPVSPRAPGLRPAPATARVLHVVASALPYRAAGYTVRTKAIVACQANAGLDPRVAVRTGYEEATSGGRSAAQVVDGIPVTWLGPKPPRTSHIDLQQQRSAEHLAELAGSLRPALLHAHSDYHQPQIALAVARALGVPAIYEVRGFWEETWASQHPGGEEAALATDRYRMTIATETAAMLAADAVVTLSEVMRREIVARGADPERVVVVPNAVDAERFRPVARDDRLAARLGIQRGDRVVGYVSSFSGYEGIPYLLEAAAIVRTRDPRIRVLLVGDGKAQESIEETAHRLGLDDGTLVMPGRVPHDEILSYYSLLDVFVVPRTAHRVSSLVTPLKPYEAMAVERAVVVSDLDALREVVTPGETGLTFRPEDPDHLADVIGQLFDDPELRARLGRQAREWVLAERTWSANGRRYRDLYERLGAA